MYRTIKTLSLSVLLAAALAAQAQTPAQNASAGNPAARGTNSSFFFGGLKGTTAPPTGSANAITRPGSRFGPVTPVPEPSEWAMLLVGLTFVGWIVRRKTKQ